MLRSTVYFMILVLLSTGCGSSEKVDEVYYPANVLDYRAEIEQPSDRDALVFSDQGAWFGFSLERKQKVAGFAGPFLMTQENGKWLSPVLCSLNLTSSNGKQVNWKFMRSRQRSYPSHLEQTFENDSLSVTQVLFFRDRATAVLHTTIMNTADHDIRLKPSWQGEVILEGIQLAVSGNQVLVHSDKSNATGRITFPGADATGLTITKNSYSTKLPNIRIKKGQTSTLSIVQQFSFAEWGAPVAVDFSKIDTLFKERVHQKQQMLAGIFQRIKNPGKDSVNLMLATKALLTLQNNWRSTAGELSYDGLFPSYHYIWFHGFWAWDSWKHAVALAEFATELAKNQIRAMYAFLEPDGFIPDCVYRDTSIENHNYRDTKPPLSGWAVWSVFEQSFDTAFLQEIYPKIKLQHQWWYKNRDFDNDGLCEYGSTDGSLIAAKWESGMDNAVRFDNSTILNSGEQAYSLNQESVDLNSYLFAEKQYLANMADILGDSLDAQQFRQQAKELQEKIRSQFFDAESGWFYDTDMAGGAFIKVMGCEGWIPLWAGVATSEQARKVRDNMMNPAYFNTKMPLPTLSAAHPDFNPNGGYWRGPVWLDQAYFGIAGLRNYGFANEADELTEKLMQNAEGLLERGPSIRENYNPLTGEGLEAQNFSWSAAHYILLLLEI